MAKSKSRAGQTAACVAYAAECLKTGGVERVRRLGGLKAKLEHEAKLRELKSWKGDASGAGSSDES